MEDVTLYDAPGGSRAVATLRQGEAVEADTGAVLLRPIPVRVRYGSSQYFEAEEGEIVFLLDYLGEGYGRIWVDGQTVDGEILSVYEHCAFPGPECWGEVVRPEDDGKQRDGVWWVQVRTVSGETGWTRELGSFAMPGCG